MAAGSAAVVKPIEAGKAGEPAKAVEAARGTEAAKAVEATKGSEIEMPAPGAPIAMTPELKAIKISLLPNWERDTVEPATISLEVRAVKETFKFRYGYEDAKAPQDREAFKKYLADSKILKVTTDRQRGAAWYLEGTDGAGRIAFRLVVVYGGRRLYCGGSSYKENGLGDIRDEVVVQAKKICETVAL